MVQATILALTLISFIAVPPLISAANLPLVTIPGLGAVQGSLSRSLNGKEFYSFEGVPYARPPVGKYRFREPIPVKPWPGTWNAQTIYKCMQYYQYTPPDGDFVIGDEDCLYLNIYTPTLDPKANLDVVVYIHGGAFMFNHGGFQQPDYIMDKKLVYVSLNYRLGPLGFLSTENEVVPGNNGLKDQILALRWIKDNINNFGGNPNSVTIMGMSAGGASVHFHYLSPKSKGLFQRGISQSGTTLNPWVLVENPLEKAKKLATHVGCFNKDTREMIDCVRRRPGRQIVAAVKIFQPWLYNPFSPFGAVIDSWSSDPVLPDHPYNLLKNKQISDLPWIVSYTNSEGLYPAAEFYQDEYLNDINSRWNELLPHILDYNYTVKPELHDQVSEKIRRYYMGSTNLSKDSFMDFVQILNDRVFIYDIRKTIQMQVAATTAPIYFYYFSYRGAHTRVEPRTGNKDFGAAHGDDTSYVFKTKVDTVSTEDDRRVVKMMVDMVASFAKEGKPSVGIDWPALSKEEENSWKVLAIGPGQKAVVERLIFENAEFWKSLPIRENEKLFSVAKDEL